jgi:hypothetical protein
MDILLEVAGIFSSHGAADAQPANSDDNDYMSHEKFPC